MDRSLVTFAGIFNNLESTIPYESSRRVQSAAAGDPLADAIRLLRPSSFHHAHLHGTGPWALRFGEMSPRVEIGVAAIGKCWLIVEDHDPLPLQEGDFYLLGGPPPYVLASELGVEPRAAKPLDQLEGQGEVSVADGEGDETRVCRAHFAFDGADASVVDALPRLVHVRTNDPVGKSLGHLSSLLVGEFATIAPGNSLVLDHLAQIIFVHMLRAYADRTTRPVGWLGALTDDHIGVALRAMHADVARRWTLAELARLAGMSRSAFAASFKQRVGRPPLEYLIEWRMSLARDALLHGSPSISELASATGYESESAFSTAFRRVVGSSPGQFRARGRRIGASAGGERTLVARDG